MKLVPLSDRVVLKQCEAEETTKSGIILTSSAQEKPQEAEVIAVGPGGMVDGKEVTGKDRTEGHLFQICRNRSKAGWRGIHHCKTERYSGCRRISSREASL